MSTKFPNTNVRFRDTRGAGGVSVEGYELHTDDDGFVEAPPRLQGHLSAHGFLMVGSKEFADWTASEARDAAVQVKGVSAAGMIGKQR